MDAERPPDSGDADWAGICPPGMNAVLPVNFEGQYCMDRYEAHIGPDGRAISAEGVVPATPVTWDEAARACRLAGKELCLLPVWHDGCTTNPWSSYPYPGGYQAGRCNDEEMARGEPWPAGSNMLCMGLFEQKYDMVGNVSEWVDCAGVGPDRTCWRCGGSFLDPPERATCNDCVQADPEVAAEGSGFRCCVRARER